MSGAVPVLQSKQGETLTQACYRAILHARERMSCVCLIFNKTPVMLWPGWSAEQAMRTWKASDSAHVQCEGEFISEQAEAERTRP